MAYFCQVYNSPRERRADASAASGRFLPPAATPACIAGLAAPIASEKREAAAALEAVARNVDVGGRLARDEPALRLVAQHRDEFGAIVGLAAQRLVRDDDRGSRQRARRNAIEHVLRDGDAV